MTARATIPPGRMIIARGVLSSLETGGYGGETSVWACRYKVEVHRVASGVEWILYQDTGGVIPAPGYEQPAIDGEAA